MIGTVARAATVVAMVSAATAETWTRTAGTVSVSVDYTTFAYSATLNPANAGGGDVSTSSCRGFKGGGVSFRCDGVHYTHGIGLAAGPTADQAGDAVDAGDSPTLHSRTLSGAATDGSGVDSLGNAGDAGDSAAPPHSLTLSGAATDGSGVDSLGAYESIAADFQGGSSASCALHTEIRYYVDTASFVFVADFADGGVAGTNSTALLSAKPGGKGPEDLPGLSTAFPSWPAGSQVNARNAVPLVSLFLSLCLCFCLSPLASLSIF